MGQLASARMDTSYAETAGGSTMLGNSYAAHATDRAT